MTRHCQLTRCNPRLDQYARAKVPPVKPGTGPKIKPKTKPLRFLHLASPTSTFRKSSLPPPPQEQDVQGFGRLCLRRLLTVPLVFERNAKQTLNGICLCMNSGGCSYSHAIQCSHAIRHRTLWPCEPPLILFFYLHRRLLRHTDAQMTQRICEYLGRGVGSQIVSEFRVPISVFKIHAYNALAMRWSMEPCLSGTITQSNASLAIGTAKVRGQPLATTRGHVYTKQAKMST